MHARSSAVLREYQPDIGVSGYHGQHQYRSFENHVPQVHAFEGNDMNIARGNNARTVLGKNAANSSSDDLKEADVVWLAEWARKYTAKEGARLSGMTPKGFQKLQAGENGISYKRLRQWMRNDMAFAIALAVDAGVILPGQAESAEAITRAVNAYMRRGE